MKEINDYKKEFNKNWIKWIQQLRKESKDSIEKDSFIKEYTLSFVLKTDPYGEGSSELIKAFLKKLKYQGTEKVDKWITFLENHCHLGVTGPPYRFIIDPSSIGDGIAVECKKCKERIDLTNLDLW